MPTDVVSFFGNSKSVCLQERRIVVAQTGDGAKSVEPRGPILEVQPSNTPFSIVGDHFTQAGVAVGQNRDEMAFLRSAELQIATAR